MIAFHGDSKVRDAALDRLEDCITRGVVQQQRLFWDGTSGSPLGCLLHSQEIGVWAGQLGLPPALAMPAEMLATDGTEGVQRLKSLIGSISPGADASRFAGQMVIWLLDDLIAGLGDGDAATGLIAVARELGRMQADALSGAGPSPQVWRSVRRQAMAQTEAAVTPVVKAASRAIEAAAWDAGAASSAFYDTLTAWMDWQMLCAGGPTPAEWAITMDVVQEVDAELRDTAGFEPELFRLLEQVQPGLPARLQQFRARIAAMSPTPAGRVHDAMIAIARALPVPAPALP